MDFLLIITLYVLSVVIAYVLGKKDYARHDLKMGWSAIIMIFLPILNIGVITGALLGIYGEDDK